jgi:putative hydrolase of the HAD superfamily
VIDVVLFDLDGVLRHFPSADVPKIEESAGLPFDSIRLAAFEDALLSKAITGIITDEIWREEIASVLADKYPGSNAQGAVRDWSARIGEIDLEMLEIVRQCRLTCRVGLVSNATSRLPRDLAMLGIGPEFDLIVNSSEIGAAKPDRKIFAHAASELKTDLERCVFVDDSLGQVTAACSFGMTGIHHVSNQSTRSALAELGAL